MTVEGVEKQVCFSTTEIMSMESVVWRTKVRVPNDGASWEL
jgi:hypothetical protein